MSGTQRLTVMIAAPRVTFSVKISRSAQAQGGVGNEVTWVRREVK